MNKDRRGKDGLREIDIQKDKDARTQEEIDTDY